MQGLSVLNRHVWPDEEFFLEVGLNDVLSIARRLARANSRDPWIAALYRESLVAAGQAIGFLARGHRVFAYTDLNGVVVFALGVHNG